MAEFPSMPFFTDAYLADTKHLTVEEHGAYILLLICMWRSPGCKLPDDDKRLARMVGVTPAKWRKLRAAISEFFIIENDHFYHGKIHEAYQNLKTKKEQNKSNGAKGGQANALKYKKRQEAPASTMLPENSSETEAYQNQNQEKKPKVSKKRNSTLPSDCPTTEDQEKAMIYWVGHNTPADLAYQVDQFRNHHQSKNTSRTDWSATWRTWYSNQRQFCERDGKSGQPRGTPTAIGAVPTNVETLPANVMSEDDIWRARVRNYQQTGKWTQTAYGSEAPDSPFTAVPPQILIEFGYGKDAA